MINLYPTEITNKRNIDNEWIDLILEAKEQGLTQEEVRSILTFLENSST